MDVVNLTLLASLIPVAFPFAMLIGSMYELRGTSRSRSSAASLASPLPSREGNSFGPNHSVIAS
jgi:hypothetical protein